MVAYDAIKRNARLRKRLQDVDAPVQVQEARVATVKQVTSMDHRVHGLIDRICDSLFKRGRKICPAQVAPVLALAEMRIADVEKTSHSRVTNAELTG
jgi:hypothetical protein